MVTATCTSLIGDTHRSKGVWLQRFALKELAQSAYASGMASVQSPSNVRLEELLIQTREAYLHVQCCEAQQIIQAKQ